MSFSETIFLFFLALIIFGPKKLPEIARQVGKALNEFRRASNEFKAQIEQEIAHLEIENRQTILPPSPAVPGTTTRTLNSAANEGNPADTETNQLATPEVPLAEAPATLAASPDEPSTVSGNGSSEPPVATEAVNPSEPVSSTSSQESHV